MIVLKIERMLTDEFWRLAPLWMGLLLLLEITVLGWLLFDGLRMILRSFADLRTRKKQAGDDLSCESIWPPAPKPPDEAGAGAQDVGVKKWTVWFED